MFNLRTKKAVGELSGAQITGTVSCLAQTKEHVLSGSEDGEIVIWRLKDLEALHTLSVRNVSPLICLAMHPSERMCLALHKNQVLRLWSLLDARC